MFFCDASLNRLVQYAIVGLGKYPPLRREVRLIFSAFSFSKHNNKILYLELLHDLVLEVCFFVS